MSPAIIFMVILVAGSCALIATPDFLRWSNQLEQQHINQLANDHKDQLAYDLNQLENDLDRQLSSAPESLMGDLEDVRFLLWTRSNSGDGEHYRLFPEDEENLLGSPFDARLPTFVLYHGFNDYGECGWIRDSKTELLRLGEANVISVDWQTLVVPPWYNYAVENVYRVSNYTAGLLDWLHDVTGLQASQLHIVGHSLGAHTAGMTGKRVKSGQVARVTGLDPAGPLFYDQSADLRIDKSDALFVDIIHANSGPIIEGCIGLFEAVGHVDFYPNGGMHQPGCAFAAPPPPNGVRSDWTDLFGGCSHARATAYWVESLRASDASEMFLAWPCSDWDTFFAGGCPDCAAGCLDMGFPTAEGLEGTFFLRTNPTSPYALGDVQ
ncbi:pancreatic lipase-related protein 2-like [Penaeus japonicus]|uniref:pancreatic lipase-related protein 2-like n=1 Tax=Penaeus japonicus TaxID=27405 RepID=UPI001C712B6B|nr:pancreatic lipase-related protein 2-like [Penaeus japonicus]